MQWGKNVATPPSNGAAMLHALATQARAIWLRKRIRAYPQYDAQSRQTRPHVALHTPRVRPPLPCAMQPPAGLLARKTPRSNLRSDQLQCPDAPADARARAHNFSLVSSPVRPMTRGLKRGGCRNCWLVPGLHPLSHVGGTTRANAGATPAATATRRRCRSNRRPGP